MKADSKTIDGILCFGGEDYWYHNRGHYDMQMMRELSRKLPVIYVNSIGMRVPRLTEGRMFATRVKRKLKSIGKGLVQVDDGHWVVSPIAAPGRIGAVMNRNLLASQLTRAMRTASIRRPLVWVACPPGAEVLDRLDPVAVVYQRTDRYEAFEGVDPVKIRHYDQVLKSQADLTLFCSTYLFDDEASQCNQAELIDHGVDYETFLAAGTGAAHDPHDMAPIPRPRVGFVGGIDSHTFDVSFFLDVAGRRPDLRFVLVGGCSLPEGWCSLPNVHLLGRKQYSEVAAYMAACDVLIMPWNSNEWIKSCNPVKLKEYLAVGRPVVSTPFPELARYDGLVDIASTAADFAAAIDEALASARSPRGGRQRVSGETWRAKADAVVSALQSINVSVVSRESQTLMPGVRDE